MSSPGKTLGSWVRILRETWMSVCVSSVFVLSCVGSGLGTGSSPVQGVLLSVYNIHSSTLILAENRPQGLIRKAKEEEERLLTVLKVYSPAIYHKPARQGNSPLVLPGGNTEMQCKSFLSKRNSNSQHVIILELVLNIYAVKQCR
jgi:hypothetical protein